MLLCHICGGDAKKCTCAFKASIEAMERERLARRYFCPNCHKVFKDDEINRVIGEKESIIEALGKDKCPKCSTHCYLVGKDGKDIEIAKLKRKNEQLKKQIKKLREN